MDFGSCTLAAAEVELESAGVTIIPLLNLKSLKNKLLSSTLGVPPEALYSVYSCLLQRFTAPAALC